MASFKDHRVRVIYLVNLLASFLFLRFGFAPEWVFILNIIFKAFVICALLWQSHIKYGFQISDDVCFGTSTSHNPTT